MNKYEGTIRKGGKTKSAEGSLIEEISDSSEFATNHLVAFPYLLFSVFLINAVGCARWYEKSLQPEPQKVQSSALPSSGTVDIETMIIRFGTDQTEDLNRVWQHVDETAIDNSQRRNLDANGFRIGVLRGELPAVILQQIERSAKQKSADIGELSGLGSDADARMRLIRCRAGGRKELMIRREIAHPLSVVTTIDGVLSGQTFYDQPATLFALTLYPGTDGTSKIELVPEVQYGQSQNRYTTTEFGVRQEAKRPTKVWKELKFSAILTKGEVLVIAATQPTKSLGGAFFLSENLQQTEEHLVLLIRLNETPMDDLFDNQSN